MNDKCQTSERDCPFDPVKWGQMIEKLNNIHADVIATNLTVKEQNGRIGKLENRYWFGLGIFTVLVFAVKLFWK